MATKLIRCSVIGACVTRVTNLQGCVTRIICPQYAADGTCRLKQAHAGAGPLAQLLARVVDGTQPGRGTACVLGVRWE